LAIEDARYKNALLSVSSMVVSVPSNSLVYSINARSTSKIFVCFGDTAGENYSERYSLNDLDPVSILLSATIIIKDTRRARACVSILSVMKSEKGLKLVRLLPNWFATTLRSDVCAIIFDAFSPVIRG